MLLFASCCAAGASAIRQSNILVVVLFMELALGRSATRQKCGRRNPVGLILCLNRPLARSTVFKLVHGSIKFCQHREPADRLPKGKKEGRLRTWNLSGEATGRGKSLCQKYPQSAKLQVRDREEKAPCSLASATADNPALR